MKKKSTNFFGKIFSAFLALIFLGVSVIAGVCLLNDDFRVKVEEKLHIERTSNSESSASDDSTKIEDLEFELANKQNDLNALNEKLAEMQLNVTRTESKLKEKQDECGLLQTEKQALTENLEAELLKNSDLKNQLSELNENNNSLILEKQEIETQLENSNLTISDLQLQLESKNQEIIQVQEEVVLLQKQLEEFQTYSQELITATDVFEPSADYTVNVGKASDITTVLNNTSLEEETKFEIYSHGSSFNQTSIDTDMSNIDYSTRKFLSKDGDKIYFLQNSQLVGFKNSDNTLNQILNVTISHSDSDVFNISAFDDFIFVFTNSAPYVHAYVIENDALTKCTLDLASDFEYYDNLINYFGADAVVSKNNLFLIGFMAPVNSTSGYTLYYTFNESSKSFIFDSYLSATHYNFEYMLAMPKTVYTDAQIMYLQPGEKSSLCKRAIHKADKTIQDTYSATAYYYTYLTTEIFARGRDIVVLKDYDPSVWIYKYPQVYRHELHENFNLTGVVDVAVSFNGVYKAFKYSDGSFKVINNADYDSFIEIELPEDLNVSEIEDFEILNNVMIFFLSDGTNCVYSFKEDMLLIENVSSKSDTYSVTLTKLQSVDEILARKVELELEISQLQKQLDETSEQLESELRNSNSKLNSHHLFITENLNLFEHYYNSDKTVVTILFNVKSTVHDDYSDLIVWTLNLETKSLRKQTFKQFANYEINQQDDLLVINMETEESISYESYTWKVSLSTGDYTIEFVEKTQVEDDI